MVTQRALDYLYPNAPRDSWRLEEVGGAVQIAYWSEALGARPTPETIAAAELPAAKTPLLAKIDADVDAVYATVIGQRAVEYQEAEEDAQAFKTAGYTGTVPPSVASWVAASGLSAQAAADNILATAAAWRGAAQSLRAARLGHKAQAGAAASLAALEAVEASWRGTLNAIRAALGLPEV